MQGGKAHGNYDYCSNLHFFIFCDIWSTVENYFQKILSPLPLKKSLPPFYSLPSPPQKKSKSASPPFLPTLKIFQAPLAESKVSLWLHLLQWCYLLLICFSFLQSAYWTCCFALPRFGSSLQFHMLWTLYLLWKYLSGFPDFFFFWSTFFV